MSLEIIIILVKESKGVFLSASIYFCAKWDAVLLTWFGEPCPSRFYNTVASC